LRCARAGRAGTTVIPILAGLWTFVGVLAFGWFVLSRRRGLWRTRLPRRQQAESAPHDVDAAWIYGDRRRWKPWAHLRETEEKRREAEAIVSDAELRARDILAESERERSQVEAELARERADLAEKSKRLSDFLANALEEVERASANGSTTSAPDLEELEALQDELRGTE
jgi:hypothetical protein